jgi:hypothetical protein
MPGSEHITKKLDGQEPDRKEEMMRGVRGHEDILLAGDSRSSGGDT